MQRAIQNTQAATRRRSRPLRVAGSTLTANVAFAVLKYAALTAAGVLLFLPLVAAAHAALHDAVEKARRLVRREPEMAILLAQIIGVSMVLWGGYRIINRWIDAAREAEKARDAGGCRHEP